ncbi:hypothetical protein EG240_04795 [Paenimyroides tangerinum]|uniref:Lipoprotein n=1 Tax=Paenimyroides tangerinum TaxID=2488728 RepID=A0A3P3WE24_9FLAO|nr:hypothetical protein [Paenimyroides tangerinum]RRJ91879.1 hypothetical protein EG240_04795 [Paenimyroides tangerinum]
MKYIYFVSFLLIGILLFGCKAKKYPYKYVTYMSDPKLKLPSDKIELFFTNDSTGYFLNYLSKDDVFKQEFIYNNSDINFVCIKRVDTINQNVVSLKPNDTIVYVKDKMYFLFRGEEKFLLYFKKEKN